jgi:regulator of cell morphogenesis and NO signaling
MALLARMRLLTNDYEPPADVCTSYRTTLQSLQALESDLLSHIALENDVLFPQAKKLAASV